MKVYNLFIFTVLLLLSLEIEAQDPHFSQFFSNPLLLNPALAGTSNGKYRVSSTYRDQWRSAIDDPLKTYTVSGDMSFSLNERSSNNPDKFAFGFNFFGDRVSQFDLNTTEVTLYGAYHKALDDKTNQYLSAGLYVGVAQKNINYEDLSFEDQFNSIDGYTLPGGEFLPINNFGYGDIGIGINYTASPSPASTIYAGIAMYHINNPNISFYKSDQSNNTSLLRNNNIDRKISVYLATSFATTPTMRIEPRVLYLKQGQSSEIDLGTNFRLLLNSEGGKYLHFWTMVANG